MNDNYNYYNGRRVTFNGFTQAITTDGKPVFYTDKAGLRQPLMMGVSEFGVPGTNEFIRGETNQKSHKVPAKFILWMPNSKLTRGNRIAGTTIDGIMYKELQENPGQYPDRLKAIEQYNLPLNIDFN